MKGIVFNLLEQCVSAEHGEETWDALLAGAELDGAYTSLGNYPDEHLLRLVATASAALKVPPADIVRWFGRRALPLMASRYGGFFTAHRHTLPFLLTLNDIIHPEVRKLYPGADVPEFDFERRSDRELAIGYRSARQLCSFAEGLIEGAAGHFRERVTFERPRCMSRGDDQCVIVCRFDAAS